MTTFTTAELRALQLISTEDGKLAVLAADQRLDLAASLERAGQPSGAEALLEVKIDLAETLGRGASAILLDPEVALPAAVDRGAVARGTGLLVALDVDKPVGDGLRLSSLVPGMDALAVRRLGGTAAKLHVWLRPDQEDLDGATAALVRSVLADCAAQQLLCVVEALTYPLADETPESFAARKPVLVREAAAFLVACGTKLLKLEYAGSVSGCAAVTEAAAGVPWAVLSAGVEHERFLGWLRDALAGGACGFIAGRSLWKDAAVLPRPERRALLADRGMRRLEQLFDTLVRDGRSLVEPAA